MKKILVVDDDQDLLSMIKGFLQRQGYEVAVTTSCEQGVEIFYSFRPGLLLLDINVGSEDGRVMCRKIKARAENAHIPIIFISANAEALATYEEHGAVGALDKPFDFMRLLELIREHE